MVVMVCKSLFKAINNLSPTDTKRVTDFIPKFYENPANPGISLERLERIKDKNLWSARISKGLRAIIYKEGETWALLYASHHDDAYHWAESHRIELNDKTGALQIVESIESVAQEFAQQHRNQPGLFDVHDDDYLLSLGLPPAWLIIIRQITSENQLLDILEKLPEEVSENFLRLATGEWVPPPLIKGKNTIDNEDTQRRFIVVNSTSDIGNLLKHPMATWIGFLHPSQRRLATGSFNGALKITGSAGTGKTVVALHRARYLAQQGKQVLLTTFVSTLCDNLYYNLKLLCTDTELANITVTTVASQARQVLKQGSLKLEVLNDEEIRKLIEQNCGSNSPLTIVELWLEWRFVIQPKGITTWEDYHSANRVGRGKPLNVKERKQIWQIFYAVFSQLNTQHKTDWAGLYRSAKDLVETGQVSSPFDAVIVDEVQDLNPQELKFLAALAGQGANNLTLVGDSGQRIYQGRFSLKSLGINVQGRSHILKLNYRTTEQIRRFADRLMTSESDDLDGSTFKRTDTVSILKGADPVLKSFPNEQLQADFVVAEVKALLAQNIAPEEIGIFSRTKNLLNAIEKKLKNQRIPYSRLDSQSDGVDPGINTGSMHRAKGLEFKAVFVISVSDGILPLPQSLEASTDQQSLEEALEQERHLLYVSVTRARDIVYICWHGLSSLYLQQLTTQPIPLLSPRQS
ncbi:MAG: AAA family ATPase [Acaryochloris sp. CRU_2_0]|nr:AAA family ATPase [Acaryochloris sp. CRU_2_0]